MDKFTFDFVIALVFVIALGCLLQFKAKAPKFDEMKDIEATDVL